MFRKLLPLVLLVFVTACTPQSHGSGSACHCKQSGVCHCMKSGDCPCAKAVNCGCHKAEGMSCGRHEGAGTCQCGEGCACPMCQQHGKEGAAHSDHGAGVPMHQGMMCHKNKAAKTR